MSLTRLAVSMDSELATGIREAAERDAGGNVSAWLAQAAERELRRAALKAAVEEFEAKHGPITEQEMAEAERLWPTKG